MASTEEKKRKRKTMDANFPRQSKVQRRSLYVSVLKMAPVEEDADKAEGTNEADEESIKKNEKNARRTLAVMTIGKSKNTEKDEKVEKENEQFVNKKNVENSKTVVEKFEESKKVKKAVTESTKESQGAAEEKEAF